MKKIFSLFAAVLFAGSMSAAVGNLYYTFATAQNSSNIAYASNYDVTIDGMDWSVPGNQNFSGYLGIGGKSLSGVDRIISSKTAMGDAIAKIKISHNGTSSDKLIVNSITIVAASNAAFTANVVEQVLMPSISKQVAGSVEFLAESGSWAKDSYYQIKINVSNSTTSNYRFDITKIEFYSYQDDSAPAIMAEKIDFGPVATTAFPVVKNAELAVTGANLSEAIAYSVIGNNVTATGSLTANGGTLNVALSANAEGEISDTIVLTSATTVAKIPVEAKIMHTDGDGSKESPFSVADVVKLNNGYGMEKYWVMGYIVGSAANGGALAADDVATNLALGDATDQTEGLVPVELPSGAIRTALNIVDNSDNKGKLVKVHGQLISYFSWSGVKATDEYEFVSDPTPALCDQYLIDFDDVQYLFAPVEGEENVYRTEKIQFSEYGATDEFILVNICEFTYVAPVLPEGSPFKVNDYGYGWYTIEATSLGLVALQIVVSAEGVELSVVSEVGPATAISNTAVEAKAVKVLRDGNLFILRDGQLYNAQGTVIR